MQNSTPGRLLGTVAVPDSPAALFTFPGSEDVEKSAAMFPGAFTAVTERAHRAVSRRAPESFGFLKDDALKTRYPTVEVREYRGFKEGIFSQLLIGPGAVKFRRRNDAAADRCIARSKEKADDAAVIESLAPYWSKLWLEDRPAPAAEANVISRWSYKSRNNLKLTVSQLDLAPLVESGIPCMVTFTLPGNWEALTPDGPAAAAIWNRFGVAWAREFGEGMQALWKREFQRRGAPHWHIWTVLPERPTYFSGDQAEWEHDLRVRISAIWTAALPFGCDGTCASSYPFPFASCHSCDERARSLRAGVRIDVTEGQRAKDPRRLAEYFLKESIGGESKAYQNWAPKLWQGKSVGRYWGTRGIKQCVSVVDIDPADAERVWRVLAGLRRSRRRADGKKIRVRGRAGFVLVNNGPVLASQIARLVRRGLDADVDALDAAQSLQNKLDYFDACRAVRDRVAADAVLLELDSILDNLKELVNLA